jgi:opacity protein-like surface antigen
MVLYTFEIYFYRRFNRLFLTLFFHRFNYHFLDNDKFDLFSTVGVGYANRSFSFTSTDPDYVSTDVKSLIPVGSKIGLGMRYFFTDNIGANLQLGFGQGGILNAGISAKF